MLLVLLRGHRRWHSRASLRRIWVWRLGLTSVWRAAVWISLNRRLVLIILPRRVVGVVVGHAVLEAVLAVGRYRYRHSLLGRSVQGVLVDDGQAQFRCVYIRWSSKDHIKQWSWPWS